MRVEGVRNSMPEPIWHHPSVMANALLWDMKWHISSGSSSTSLLLLSLPPVSSVGEDGGDRRGGVNSSLYEPPLCSDLVSKHYDKQGVLLGLKWPFRQLGCCEKHFAVRH